MVRRKKTADMEHVSKGKRAIFLKGIPEPSPELLLAVALSDNVPVSSDQIVVAIPAPLPQRRQASPLANTSVNPFQPDLPNTPLAHRAAV